MIFHQARPLRNEVSKKPKHFNTKLRIIEDSSPL